MTDTRLYRIAIAGGAAPSVGQTITRTLVEHGHHVVILSRSSTTSIPLGPNGKPYHLREVDYAHVDTIVSVLDDEQIDTVITILPSGVDATTQLNLVHAAQRCRSVTRFLPNEWGQGDHINRQVLRLRKKCDVLAELRRTDLRWTCILPGMYFLNYLAQGSPHNPDGEAMSGLAAYPRTVDIEHHTAIVPGTGDQPQVCTRLEDLAEGVAMVLQDPDEAWGENSWIVGDLTSWNEIIRLAEQVTRELSNDLPFLT